MVGARIGCRREALSESVFHVFERIETGESCKCGAMQLEVVQRSDAAAPRILPGLYVEPPGVLYPITND